jgi:hypothetical protein
MESLLCLVTKRFQIERLNACKIADSLTEVGKILKVDRCPGILIGLNAEIPRPWRIFSLLISLLQVNHLESVTEIRFQGTSTAIVALRLLPRGGPIHV